MEWQQAAHGDVARLTRKRFKKQLKQIDKQLAEGHPNHRGVHQVRVELKRLRAMLLLLRADLAERDYLQAKNSSRTLAHDLAASRESKVLRDTLALLLLEPGEQALKAKALSAITLQQQPEHAAKARQLRNDRDSLAQQLDALSLNRLSASTLQQGLKRNYRKGRRQWQQIRCRPEREALHTWRRSVKQLLYQLQLLVPEQHPRYLKQLNELGKLLGQLHDLHDLENWMERSLRQFWLEERLQLKARIRQRESQLLAQIMALGKRLYRRGAGEFCRWQLEG